MKIRVIAVGKLKEKYLKEGIAEYSKRLQGYCDFEIVLSSFSGSTRNGRQVFPAPQGPNDLLIPSALKKQALRSVRAEHVVPFAGEHESDRPASAAAVPEIFAGRAFRICFFQPVCRGAHRIVIRAFCEQILQGFIMKAPERKSVRPEISAHLKTGDHVPLRGDGDHAAVPPAHRRAAAVHTVALPHRTDGKAPFHGI